MKTTANFEAEERIPRAMPPGKKMPPPKKKTGALAKKLAAITKGC